MFNNVFKDKKVIVPTEEPGLRINIDRLLTDNFIIRNDFQNEIRQLLIYCHKNFKPFD